jgi:predicted DNA-binding antitoxin AbrB/MazE fold protein
MKAIHAVYEGGVFRPLEAVDLPERSEVEFTPTVVNKTGNTHDMQPVYEILEQAFSTGDQELAERHGEHQP